MDLEAQQGSIWRSPSVKRRLREAKYSALICRFWWISLHILVIYTAFFTQTILSRPHELGWSPNLGRFASVAYIALQVLNVSAWVWVSLSDPGYISGDQYRSPYQYSNISCSLQPQNDQCRLSRAQDAQQCGGQKPATKHSKLSWLFKRATHRHSDRINNNNNPIHENQQYIKTQSDSNDGSQSPFQQYAQQAKPAATEPQLPSDNQYTTYSHHRGASSSSFHTATEGLLEGTSSGAELDDAFKSVRSLSVTKPQCANEAIKQGHDVRNTTEISQINAINEQMEGKLCCGVCIGQSKLGAIPVQSTQSEHEWWHGVCPGEECQSCEAWRPLRAKHCHDCDRCVLKFDHHCHWVGRCVGELNHAKFLLYLFIELIQLLVSLAIVVGALKILNDKHELTDAKHKSTIVLLFVVTVLLAVFLAFVSLLLMQHVYLVSCNKTTYEQMRQHKLPYLQTMPNDLKGTAIFSQGCIKNWQLSFSFSHYPYYVPQHEYLLQKQQKQTIFSNKHYSCFG